MRNERATIMKPFTYLFVFLAPVCTIVGIQLGGAWPYATGILAFGLIPLCAVLARPNAENLSPSAESAALANRGYEYAISLAVPVQYATVLHLLYVMKTAPLA